VQLTYIRNTVASSLISCDSLQRTAGLTLPVPTDKRQTKAAPAITKSISLSIRFQYVIASGFPSCRCLTLSLYHCVLVYITLSSISRGRKSSMLSRHVTAVPLCGPFLVVLQLYGVCHLYILSPGLSRLSSPPHRCLYFRFRAIYIYPAVRCHHPTSCPCACVKVCNRHHQTRRMSTIL
jgi:hypothetical protein